MIGWLKYFAGYNLQLCLGVNVKPPQSPFPSDSEDICPENCILTIHGEASHVSCLGGISTELVHELIRGLDDLCPCLQFLVPYFQNDFEDTCLESCHYWVQIKSPT